MTTQRKIPYASRPVWCPTCEAKLADKGPVRNPGEPFADFALLAAGYVNTGRRSPKPNDLPWYRPKSPAPRKRMRVLVPIWITCICGAEVIITADRWPVAEPSATR